MRRIYLFLAVVLVALLLAPAAAHPATPRTGAWTGKLDRWSSKVRFSVDRGGRRLVRFKVYAPIFCPYNGTLQFINFYVSSAPIRRNGTFFRELSPSRNSRVRLKGRFVSSTRVKGSIYGAAYGCYGENAFTARRGR